jgi:hypothetical protein
MDFSAIGDNLGNHVATTTLNMNGQSIVNVASATFSSSVTVKNDFGATGYMSITTMSVTGASTFTAVGNIYINGGTDNQVLAKNGAGGPLKWMDISAIGDNLGNHVATTTLNMATYDISNAGYIAAVSAGFSGSVTASSLTATGPGVSAARVELAGNVFISSESAGGLGGGVRVSSNVYIVGFASATKFYGDGSGLTGITATALGDNLGNHIATATLNVNGNSIVNVASATFNKNVTVYSTVTVLAPDTAASSLWISTSNVTPHLYISTGGSVGLGTASPNANIEVAGTANPGGYIMILNSGPKVAAWLRNK